MASRGTQARRLATGLAFIAPNIAGFLAFTLLPLIVSFAMAFTNWDVQLHNRFRDESVRFAGLGNFVRLLGQADFYKYLGNTLFLMLGIPIGVAGSLFAAILLSQDLDGGRRRVRGWILATVGMTVGAGMLLVVGMGASAMVILLAGLAGLILLGGTFGQRTWYRTLFYFPHFTSGVATFLLWKKLYNPNTGPINAALRPGLAMLGEQVNRLGPTAVQAGLPAALGLMVLLVAWAGRKLRRLWRDGEIGLAGVILALGLQCLPALVGAMWLPTPLARALSGAAALVAIASVGGAIVWRREYLCPASEGLGIAVFLFGGLLVVEFILVGLGAVLHGLPAASAAGLAPPEWLASYHWAKPALMFMGLWASIGSNNMLLYLAGLSNVPVELYEAADIDGASRMQRFWYITWPQLAPITFFILVMSVIGGLQGGFEMARTMTWGGPAGGTTTLSYYVYNEGFQTGRLGYASAVAWTLFAMVFTVTLINWRFGNRYIND